MSTATPPTGTDVVSADTAVVRALRRIRVPQTQRNRELFLLIFAFAINGSAVALVQLGALGAIDWTFLVYCGGLTALVVALHIVLRLRGARGRPVRGADRHAAHRTRSRDDLSHRHRPEGPRLGGRIHPPAGLGGHRARSRDRRGRAAAQLPRALPLHLRLGPRRHPAAPAADHPRPRHRRERRRLGVVRVLLVPAR